MDKIYIKARAKLNLNLEIVNRREDGYHDLKSVFQKINLYDEITISKTYDDMFKLITNMKELNSKDNIIYKAYVKLQEIYNISGIEVRLIKKIPLQAGLGGGSTDCANFLIAMNRLFSLNLSIKEIENLGKTLGADVVPCLYNRAVIAEGIGDIITQIDTGFKYYIVIIKPDISCNTREMYKRIDDNNIFGRIDKTKEIVRGLEKNDLELITSNLHNAFEEVIESKELIENIKLDFKNNGAMASLLTGSGSCVYGIFKNKEEAYFAYNKFKDKFQTFICTSYNSKREV